MVVPIKKVAAIAALVAALLFPQTVLFAVPTESQDDPDMQFINGIISSPDEFLGWPEDYTEEPNPPSTGGITVEIKEAKNQKDKKLMDMICSHWKNKRSVTPLCGDWDKFYKLKGISENGNVPFTLQIGINNKESKLGTAYNRSACATRNNWGWTKASIDADGKKKTKKFPDSQGCYLYPFDSVEEFWTSQARSLRNGYLSKWCKTSSCIAKWYLTGDRVKWASDVDIFYRSGLENSTELATLP